ncbi:redoxin domain-containing protein, partial [Lolliginicoccus lacisalsi]|uniref:redoxin domain-containing protein n=1 Tax=Lolliginicoccus lacisalsi TaxID=2742202 RepID=UPI001CDC1198
MSPSSPSQGEERSPAVGDLAPGFALRDQNNQHIELASYRGRKNVLLVFFPLAYTGTCQGEVGQIRDNIDTFRNDTTEIL